MHGTSLRAVVAAAGFLGVSMIVAGLATAMASVSDDEQIASAVALGHEDPQGIAPPAMPVEVGGALECTADGCGDSPEPPADDSEPAPAADQAPAPADPAPAAPSQRASVDTDERTRACDWPAEPERGDDWGEWRDRIEDWAEAWRAEAERCDAAPDIDDAWFESDAWKQVRDERRAALDEAKETWNGDEEAWKDHQEAWKDRTEELKTEWEAMRKAWDR